MNDIQLKIRLAKAFGQRIQAALSANEFRTMIDRNKSDPDETVCHSHDFCDANMEMLAAFTEIMDREPTFLKDMNDESDCPLWKDAWAIAVAADFFA